jgi:hypothetical protein
MDDLDLGPILEELARAALDHRRVGRDCCAQQLDQVWIRLSRAARTEQLAAQAPT